MQIDENIKIILSSATIEGNNLTITEKLDRNQYVKVNEAIELLGGKWNRKAKAHVFPFDPKQALSKLDSAVKLVSVKKEFQIFETPVDLAEQMVLKACIDWQDNILEPSAGRGRIVSAIQRIAPRNREKITCVEILEENCAELKKLNTDKRLSIHCGDFLEFNGMIFDRILMNPPFTKGQDIKHISHAYSLLKPKGRLVAICSPGWTFNSQSKMKAFREWFEGLEADGMAWREEIEAGTFKESGTQIRTMMLVIDK